MRRWEHKILTRIIINQKIGIIFLITLESRIKIKKKKKKSKIKITWNIL